MGRILGGIFGGFFRLLGGLLRGIFRGLLGRVGCTVLLIVLVLGILWAVTNPNVRAGFGQLLGIGQTHTVSAPVVITQIRGMSTLVTAAFESQVSVEVYKDSLFTFLPAERVFLQVEGTILAGIDLTQITEQDVTINGNEVVVHIPPAHIVSQDVHNASLVTDQGILPGIDPALQTAAEERGKAELLQAACAYGVLDKAEQEVQVALGDLLRKLDDVRTIRLIQDDPAPGFVTGCT